MSLFKPLHHNCLEDIQENLLSKDYKSHPEDGGWGTSNCTVVVIKNAGLSIVSQDYVNSEHWVKEVIEIEHRGNSILQVHSVHWIEFSFVRKEFKA